MSITSAKFFIMIINIKQVSTSTCFFVEIINFALRKPRYNNDYNRPT